MDATLTALREMTVGDALGRVPLPVQALVAGLLTGTAAWTAVRPRPLPAVAFTACALMWARANQRLEGPVLVTFAPGHGLVVADLLPPVLLALVLARVAAGRRRAARCDGRDAGRPAVAGVPRG